MAEYTGMKELIVDKIENSELVASFGLAAGAVYRADMVYDTVDGDQFVVIRFGNPGESMGANSVIPFEILGYCGDGDSDQMKRISGAIVEELKSLLPEKTETGRFLAAEYVSIGRDLYDVGYQSMVLVTNMRCVGSGY